LFDPVEVVAALCQTPKLRNRRLAHAPLQPSVSVASNSYFISSTERLRLISRVIFR